MSYYPTTPTVGSVVSPTIIPTVNPTYDSATQYALTQADDVAPKLDLLSKAYSVPLVGNVLGRGMESMQHTGQGLGTDWSNMSGMQKMGSVVGLGQGLYGMYNAYKQNKLAKDTFNFQKRSWNLDHANQVKTVNSQMSDRQEARVAQADAVARATGRPMTTTSVSDYMNKYGVK